MGPQKPTRTLLLPVLNVSNHDSSYCSNWEDIVAPNSIVIVEDEEAPNDVVAAPKIEELVAPDAGAGEEEKAKENFLHTSFVFLYKLQILLEYLQVPVSIYTTVHGLPLFMLCANGRRLRECAWHGTEYI